LFSSVLRARNFRIKKGRFNHPPFFSKNFIKTLLKQGYIEMDLIDSTYILKNILSSEVDLASARNRLWVKKLTCVSPADALLSGKLAKEIVRILSSRRFVLLVPRESVPLFTEKELSKKGVLKLQVPGIFNYWAAKTAPLEVLFRNKKTKKAELTQNAAQIIDLRLQWLELLPFETRFINGKLVLRAAAFLEHLRLATEADILKIGNPEEWKRADKKGRQALEYGSILTFDRLLIINLLRRNLMELTPRAEYYFHTGDALVNKATKGSLHYLIFSVSRQNRYRFFPTSSGN